MAYGYSRLPQPMSDSPVPPFKNKPIEFEKDEDVAAWRSTKDLFKTRPLQALDVLKEQAEKGVLLSMLELGIAYGLGQGVPLDLTEAERWIRPVANLKSVRAHYLLGNVYLKQGKIEDAIQAFQFSDARAFLPATLSLATLFYSGRYTQRDLNRAQRYAWRAMSRGNVWGERFYAGIL